MPDKDHKRAEREICVDLGGSRSGPLGFNSPDCIGTPGIAVEVKLVPGFRLRSSWLNQAKLNAREDEWVLIQKQRMTGQKIVTLDYKFFKELYNLYLQERSQ